MTAHGVAKSSTRLSDFTFTFKTKLIKYCFGFYRTEEEKKEWIQVKLLKF